MESLSFSPTSYRAVTTAPEGSISTQGDTQAQASPAAEVVPAPTSRQVEEAVKEFKSFVQDVQRNLDFSVDDSSGKFIVKVIDGDSGKLVRQIPSEELLKLTERLEDLRSLLFEEKA